MTRHIDTGQWTVGDTVHQGAGKTVWKITGFWVSGHEVFASLQRPDAQHVNASATLDRLVRVS